MPHAKEILDGDESADDEQEELKTYVSTYPLNA
jgi:hypothetical protein